MDNLMDFNIKILHKKIEDTLFSINPHIQYGRFLEFYIDEIIARLFVRIYGMHPNTNISAYFKEHIESNIDVEIINADDALKMMRRKEKAYLEKQNEVIRDLINRGYRGYLSQTARKPHEKSIPKDTANMIMMNEMSMHNFEIVNNRDGTKTRKQIDTFMDIIKRQLTSNNLSSDKIENAFRQIDDHIEETKVLTDKKEYIDRWVNFYRMETRLHISLINKIADYMACNNIKDFPQDDILAMFYWTTLEFRDANIKILSEPISILRYDRYICKYFSETLTEEIRKNITDSRVLQVVLVNKHLDDAMELLSPYFQEEITQNTIDTIYDFCKTNYPIIELHQDFNFDFENPTQYSKKIQCCRKLIKFFCQKSKKE